MAPVAVKPGLSFARVAAAGTEVKTRPNNSEHSKSAEPRPRAPGNGNVKTVPSQVEGRENGMQSAKCETDTRRKDSTQHSPSQPHNTSYSHAGSQSQQASRTTLPVSEENIIQLTKAHQSSSPAIVVASLTSGTHSVTTNTLDEKESLRPDDSASVMASIHGAGDRHVDRQHSVISSESDPGAFHDQLVAIANADSTPSLARPYPVGMPSMSYNNQPSFQPQLVAIPPSIVPSNMVPSAHQDVPDEKLLEALLGKDRLWLLQVEQDIIGFIHATSAHFYDIQQCNNSFHRLLAHRVADYYYLAHTLVEGGVDRTQAVVRLLKTSATRMPRPLASFSSPSVETDNANAATSFQILRRQDTRPNSRDGQRADGDSGSETSRKKTHASREEREARYELARLRIMGSKKPSEVDLTQSKEQEDSRSSSATSKRKPAGKRSDFDDDFEARSAYNPYNTSPLDYSIGHGYEQTYLHPMSGGIPYGAYPYAYGMPGAQPPFHPPFNVPGGAEVNPAFISWDSQTSSPTSPAGVAHHSGTATAYQPQYANHMYQNGGQQMYPSPQTYQPAVTQPVCGSAITGDVEVDEPQAVGSTYRSNQRAYGPSSSDATATANFNPHSKSFVPTDDKSSVTHNPLRRERSAKFDSSSRNQDGMRRQGSQRNGQSSDKPYTHGRQTDANPLRSSTNLTQFASRNTPIDSIHKWATPASLPNKPPPQAIPPNAYNFDKPSNSSSSPKDARTGSGQGSLSPESTGRKVAFPGAKGKNTPVLPQQHPLPLVSNFMTVTAGDEGPRTISAPGAD